jgi:2-dehydro-3-deoxygalactonokinase
VDSLITVDWGSTSLRASLWQGGSIAQHAASELGVLRVPERQFVNALLTVIRPWLKDLPSEAPIVMSGMIGSRLGWKEAPYVNCPANLNSLAANLTRINASHPLLKDRELWIIPGVCQAEPADVMRGEETQILGLLASGFLNNLNVSNKHLKTQIWLPGTHCKQVVVAQETIVSFTTVMTGELFNVLSQHSILKASLPEPPAQNKAIWDAQAFAQAVQQVVHSNQPLSADLFSIRAKHLLGQISSESVGSYLSGLTIGQEVKMALNTGIEQIILVGEPLLCERYEQAFLAGANSNIVTIQAPTETAEQGAMLIARLH